MSYDQRTAAERVLGELHLRPTCSLGALAGLLGISPRAVEAIVIHAYGKRFKELRQESLLVKVQEILAQQPLISIKELSFAAGFKSPRSFGRAIRRISHCTPTELRGRRFVSADREHSGVG